MSDVPAPPEEARETHLLDYWRIIWRGRWMVIGVFVVVVTLVAIGTFTQKPGYRATATVEISPQARKVAPVADVAEMGTGSYGWFAEERFFNTQYEIIKSRDVAQRVFEKLDLYNHPLFRKSKDPVGALTKMIQVHPIKDTGIVEISLEGPNPAEVALWVNTTAEAYVDRNMAVAVNATATAVKRLFGEIEALRGKLESTEKTSFDFAERANLFVPENQQKITGERLSKLQTELTDVEVKRSEVESVLKQVDAIRKIGGSFEAIQQIANDPVLQDLYRNRVGLEREHERLLLTYKPKHVRVLEKEREIEELNQKIASETEKIIGGLRTQYALLQDQEDKLTRTMVETRAESLQDDRKASTYSLVRGEATETKRIYDLISSRIKEIDLSSSLLSNNLKVLDQAPVPKVAVKPRVVLNMAVGILLGLLLGVGAVFFMDYLDNTVRSSEDIEQFLKLNLLAIVPRQTEDTERAVREAYQNLRTGLLFSRRGPKLNALLITSAGPQEGKSCTAINLARTLAASGEKTIVLDCDLRRPTVHQRLNLDREHGITNYILSGPGDDWQNYVKNTDQPNLFALTCGTIPPNPADVFGHERFKNLLMELRQKYDWVFIDSPPVVSLSDAVILASMADMIAFVVRHNTNDKDLIRRCVNNVRKVNPHVAGAVLNNVDLDRSHYKDYYYVGYYYYGQGESGKKGRRRSTTGGLAGVKDDRPVEERLTRTAG